MQFIVGKAYKMRNGKKAIYLGNMKDYFNDSTYIYPLNFASKTTTFCATEEGSYRSDGDIHVMDIIGEWVEPHPLEGIPVGTLIYVWEDNPLLRYAVKFKEITKDGKVYGQYIYGGGGARFKNGCRIPVGDI